VSLLLPKIDPIWIADEACVIDFCGQDSVINVGDVGGSLSGRINIFIARDAPVTGDPDKKDEE